MIFKYSYAKQCDRISAWYLICLWFMCCTAHGEQCCMAEVPPNRTHCDVTGSIWIVSCCSIFQSVTQVFRWGFNCRPLCFAAVRHKELSGVVDQPLARRRAARAGWREIRRRHQLCLCKFRFMQKKKKNCWCHIYTQIPHVSVRLCKVSVFECSTGLSSDFHDELSRVTHTNNIVTV